MKKSIVLLTLFLFVSFSGYSQEDADIIKTGDTMPSFIIVSDDGKEFKSSVLKGKVILVTFFATWCPPCQKELAAIEEQLWSKYGKNNDFSLLVIGREHSDAELKEYNEKKNFTFPLYPDKNRAIYNKFAKSLIPRVYLIGKDGKVKYQNKGFTEEDFASLMKQIEVQLKR